MLESNTADVLNRVVNEIIPVIKNTAPEVWRVAYTQALINGYEYLFGAIVSAMCFPVSLYTFVWGLKREKKVNCTETDKYVVAIGVGGVMSVLFLVMGICLAVNAVDFLANPSYQAIHLILSYFAN